MYNSCIFCIHITWILHCDKQAAHTFHQTQNQCRHKESVLWSLILLHLTRKRCWETSLIHRDFGSELFGRRHRWPAETDPPRRRQRPFSSDFVENCITVNDFYIRAALTTSPLSTVRWTWCRFVDPKSDAFSTSLHRRQINPHVLAVKYSRAH